MTEQELDEEIEKHLERGQESNLIEFKGPGARTEKDFMAKVVRAVLAMANRRDGGFVVIGVKDGPIECLGLEPDQLESWRKWDEVSDKINSFATPSVLFETRVRTIRGKQLVVLDVKEFAEIPILCRKEYQVQGGKSLPTLRRGACYVRSRHKPESAEIRSEEEMRELLELAIDKGVEKFVKRAWRVGLFPAASPSPSRDEDLFEDQIGELE